MKKPEYLLKQISNLLAVGIFHVQGEDMTSFQEYTENNPVYRNKELRMKLRQGAAGQNIPYILQDQYKVYFACIRKEDSFYMAGPMACHILERIELRKYYKSYGIEEVHEKRLKHFSHADMLDIVKMIANILLDEEYTDYELGYANHIMEDTRQIEKREKILFDMKKSEEDLYHHTYQEERRLLDSVREGRVEDALRLSRNMDADLGKLSEKEFNHWKNVAVVAITLCTRAAIEGGISPPIAYTISDFYIQKCDVCSEIVQLIKYRNYAVEELASQVKKRQERKMTSYVDRCQQYIADNYKKKIYLKDIAEKMDLSEAYLSRLFRRETGKRFQDYVIDVRLEHAANLLKYSEEAIPEIAEYVNFPSQSYMGKLFKKKYNLTPKQYREIYRPSEFFQEEERTKKG